MKDGVELAVHGRKARGAKSKTGCATCRIRHVKCDEQKPSCRRCSSSGRTCDGYSLMPTESSSPPQALSARLFANKKETRYFEYFLNNTVLKLVGFNHASYFWNHTVLQLSQSSPAVLHAVVALSALHEDLNSDTTAFVASGSKRVFLQQYNKSIAHLRSRRNVQDIHTTLSCCIVFICLEMAQGNNDVALEHLRSGLRIIQNWKTGRSSKTPEQEAIAQIFRRLDVQATVFLNSRQPELNATSNKIPYESIIPECFSNLQEAQITLEGIEIRILYVLTTKAPVGCSLSKEEFRSQREPLLQALSARFTEWKAAFDAYSAREGSSMPTKDLQMSILLALHYQTMSLMLDINLDDSEESPVHDTRFRSINNIARTLIRSNTASGKFRLSADTGIIAPLYFSAMIAVNPETRQQAISLLRQIKWREGFWDAETVARIAENVLSVKTNGIAGVPVTGGVPELAGVHVNGISGIVVSGGVPEPSGNHSLGVPTSNKASTDKTAEWTPISLPSQDSWLPNQPFGDSQVCLLEGDNEAAGVAMQHHMLYDSVIYEMM